MGTINQNSVREEFYEIKKAFKAFTSKNKVAPELLFMFKSLITIMELLLAIFLEKTTKKTSKNSSKPSCQTDNDESALNNKGSKSKGKTESKSKATHMRTNETVVTIQVEFCETCGADLRNEPCSHHERRTTVDIVFEKKVSHIDVEIKQCLECDSIVKGKFPDNMPGPKQYGNGIKAYVINLIISQMMSLQRVQKLVNAMIHEVIAEATLLKFIFRLHDALAQWEAQAIETLLLSPAMHCDETSLRVDKKNQWIHVYSADDITLKLLHPKRGKDAINDFNIIPRYGGSVIHDCWASYLSYDNCNHGLCGSHLLRELTHAVDSNKYRWAANMKKLLSVANKMVSKSKRKKLTKPQYAKLQRQYRNILTRAEKELPAIPARTHGKKGKIAKSDAHNLLERLQKHESAVLLFARNANVSFTNNRAERDLRMAKVKQKVSGCFRTEKYAKAYCRISSYLQTMTNRGYNPLVAIQIALDGKDLEGCE